MFGVVDETTTTKFASRACGLHCISLSVVVDKVVVVVLKFPNCTLLDYVLIYYVISLQITTTASQGIRMSIPKVSGLGFVKFGFVNYQTKTVCLSYQLFLNMY